MLIKQFRNQLQYYSNMKTANDSNFLNVTVHTTQARQLENSKTQSTLNLKRVQSANSTTYTKNSRNVSSKLNLMKILQSQQSQQQLKKIRIQSANAFGMFKSQAVMAHNRVLKNGQFSCVEASQKKLSNTSVLTMAEHIHVFVDNVNVMKLASNLNQEYHKHINHKKSKNFFTGYTDFKPTLSTRVDKQTDKPINNQMCGRRLTNKNNSRNVMSGKSLNRINSASKNNLGELLNLSEMQLWKNDKTDTKVEQALINSKNSYCKFKEKDFKLKMVQSEKQLMNKVNFTPKVQIYNEAASLEVDKVEDFSREMSPFKSYMDTNETIQKHFVKNLNQKEKLQYQTVTANQNQRPLSILDQTQQTSHQLGILTHEPSDKKYKGYYKNMLINAINKSQERQTTLQQPTNPKEDLDSIKKFRKLKINCDRKEIYKKIEDTSVMQPMTLKVYADSSSEGGKTQDKTVSFIEPPSDTHLHEESSRRQLVLSTKIVSATKSKVQTFFPTKEATLDKDQSTNKNQRQHFHGKNNESGYLSSSLEKSNETDRNSQGTKRNEFSVQQTQSDDYKIMQYRNIQHRIVGNRLRLLGQQDFPRKFFHKCQTLTVDTLDPIRMRFKVIPIESALVNNSKSAEYYFVQAMKYCEKNMIPYAIEELRKGLFINPDNLQCRFNHGVLMFKLGLVSQALSDFQRLADMSVKDPQVYYNLSLVRFQMGHYEIALKIIQTVQNLCQDVINSQRNAKQSKTEAIESYVHEIKFQTEKQRATFELLYDAHILKAMCLWRIDPTNIYNPLEAVKNLKLSVRYKQWASSQTAAPKSTKELLRQLRDQVYREFKTEIKEMALQAEALRSKSQIFQKNQLKISTPDTQRPTLLPARKNLRRLQSDQYLKSPVKVKNIRDMPKPIKETDENSDFKPHEQSHDFKSCEEVRLEKKYHTKSCHSCQSQKSKPKENEDIPDCILEDYKDDITSNSKPDSKFKKLDPKLYRNNKLTQQNKIKVQQLKDDIVAQRVSEAISKEMMFIRKAENYYNQMKSESLENINLEGIGRFEAIFSDILAPFKAQMVEEYTNLIEQCKKIHNKTLKAKMIDLLNEKISEQTYLTEEERQQQMFRQQVFEEYQKDMKMVQLNFSVEERFMELLISGNDKQKNIKDKELQGYEFEGIPKLLKDQDQIEDQQQQMEERISQIAHCLDKDIKRQNKKIFQTNIRKYDISKLILRRNLKQDDKVIVRDHLLKQMQEIFEGKSQNPDFLCNILQHFIDQKQKQREEEFRYNPLKLTRLSVKTIELLKYEFMQNEGKQRACNIIDQLLRHLTYFTRFGEKERKIIYENAEFMQRKPQSVIFKQGDAADCMYIILKGRIAVEILTDIKLPQVISLLKDGDHFGELGLIDIEKVDRDTQKLQVNELTGFKVQRESQYAKRGANCKTTEETYLLKLSLEVATALYQSDNETHQIVSPNHKMCQEKLVNRIKFLKSIPYFANVDPKQLMPIALNIVTQTYSFGQYLVKKGEIPPGLFIIQSGTCHVVADRISHRSLKKERANAFSKKAPTKFGIYDPLLIDYNPETTVLNQVNSAKDIYHHQRVLVNEKGKEIKDRIEFYELMKFKDLMNGNYFGARSLVPFEIFQNSKKLIYGDLNMEKFNPKEKESEELFHLKSLLSVVASSSKVKVWILDKGHMNYLPDKVLQQVYEEIIIAPEEDRPYPEGDIDFIIEQFIRWDNFKVQVVNQLFKEKNNKLFVNNA